MAEGKKIAYWYVEWNTIFSKLSNEEAGKLAKHFAAYVADENPSAPDRTTELLFIPIQCTLKRDLVKYRSKCTTNKLNGSLGGRPPKPRETQENRTVISETQHNPEKPDKDKDKDKGREYMPAREQKIADFWGAFDMENLPAPEKENMKHMAAAIFTKYDLLLKFQKPLTARQLYGLMKKYGAVMTMDVVMNVDNTIDITATNRSAESTVESWLRYRKEKGGPKNGR